MCADVEKSLVWVQEWQKKRQLGNSQFTGQMPPRPDESMQDMPYHIVRDVTTSTAGRENDAPLS
jgi:hypothetical protein